MADDVEMTLIPRDTESATGSAAAEPPKQDTTNIFGRFRKKLLFAEETVVFFKHLSILGLVGGVIGTAVGSYFQYVSWREEQNIARYKEDFATATAVFGDVASTLSTAVNLQQILYFTFRDAVDAGVDKNDDAFQTKTARDTYKSYLEARNALRERIDALARKMEIYVDWPSDRNRDPTVQRSADPLNSHSLGAYDFDCAKYLPNSTSIETLKVDSIPKPDTTASLQVDWRSTKHHIVALQYCFETVHRLILAARQWAAKSSVTPEMMNKIIRDREKIQAAFDQLVERLNAFMMLTMWRIQDIRLRYQTKNYLCHLFPVMRWCA
jgi:hypothetical protein